MLNQRVLIADTDLTTRRVLEVALENLGADVVVRRDGGEALAALEEAGYDFDLLLLGFEMPRASGLDVLSAVRSINSHTRVILFGEDAAQAIVASEYGATAFVQTPTSPAEVARLMLRLQPRAAELASV